MAVGFSSVQLEARMIEFCRKAHIDTTPFHTSTRIDDLITEVETLYTNAFESGDRTRAMESLRVPPLEEKQAHIVTFRVGVFVGEIVHALST